VGFELNATAASVLGFLIDGPRAGWDIASTIETTLGDFWNVTRSQIYRELRSLSDEGLVTPGEAGARDRRPYTITEAGRDAFLSWLQAQPGDDIIRVPLLLKLSFARHLDESTLTRFVDAHRARHAVRLAGYRELEAAFDRDSPEGHVLRYGILHEEAVLAWFDTLPWSRDGYATKP
jgi:DNA-binding PadR family transcriptional regulator